MPPDNHQAGNSLAVRFPRLATEWHPVKNGDLTAYQVTIASHTKIWWTCPIGPDHEWQARVAARTRKKRSGCPCCAGKKFSVTNSLATVSPGIAAQWHPTRNGSLMSDRIIVGSNRSVWWKCSEGPDHEWYATVRSRRYSKASCPFCSGRRVSVTNSLEAQAPDAAAQWHPTKNGSLMPDRIRCRSDRTVWWQCPRGPDHEWQAPIYSRTRLGTGCPFCRSLRVSMTNSLETRTPEVAAQWHSSKNGSLTPRDVVVGSNKRAWWKCPNGVDHEWQAMISSRTRSNTGCPYCAGRRPRLASS